MKMSSKALVAISLLSAVSLTHAAEGFYIGFNLGEASYDASVNDVNDGSFTSGSLDDSDTSFSVTLGKQFTPNFALEGGYIDLGEVNIDAVSDGSGFLYAPGAVNANVELSGVFFDVKGLIPLNETSSFYGKVGILSWDADFSLSDSTGSLSISDDGTDVFFGLGASFAMSNSFSLNIDYTSYDLDDGDTADVFSVGVQFNL